MRRSCTPAWKSKVAPHRRKLWGKREEGRRPILDMSDLIELVKMVWVMGCKVPSCRMQKKGVEAGAGTRAKYCIIGETGLRSEPGIPGSGTKRRWSLCWRVLDHLMQRTALCKVNFMSAQQRCELDQSSWARPRCGWTCKEMRKRPLWRDTIWLHQMGW